MKVLKLEVAPLGNGDPQSVSVVVQRLQGDVWLNESSFVINSSDEDSKKEIALADNQRITVEHLGATEVVLDRDQSAAVRRPRQDAFGAEFAERDKKRQEDHTKAVLDAEHRDIEQTEAGLREPKPLSTEEMQKQGDLQRRRDALNDAADRAGVPRPGQQKAQARPSDKPPTNQTTTRPDGSKPTSGSPERVASAPGQPNMPRQAIGTPQHPAGAPGTRDSAVNPSSPSQQPASHAPGGARSSTDVKGG